MLRRRTIMQKQASPAYVRGSCIILCYDGNNAYQSFDFGQSWHDTGISAAQSSAMSSDGRYRTIIRFTSPRVRTSSDYGQTWANNSQVPSLTLARIAMSDDGRYQVISSASGAVYLSVDFGQNWSAIQITSRYYTAVGISSSGEVILLGSIGGLFLSTDLGQNWQQVASSLTPDFHVYDIALSGDGSQMHAVGIFPSEGGAPSSALLQNSGSAWFIAYDVPDESAYDYPPSAGVSNDLQTRVVSSNGLFFRSIGGGAWSVVRAPFSINRGVHISGDGSFVYALNNSSIARSSNVGDNWTTLTLPISANIRSISINK